MLIAADHALKSAAEAGNWTSEEVDKKFGDAIRLLSGFEKDFPSEDPTSDPDFDGTVSRETKMSNKSKSPSAILHALKENLHSKVTFSSVSLLLNADEA